MFPKRPRFNPLKPSDVPGPNAYNPQDPVVDNYKRGAFLEKADRFMPVLAAGQDPMPAQRTSPTQPATERYAALQKKVDDLERVHVEGKKTHHIELEKLKQELALAQKLASDHSDRLDKQAKQKSALEAVIQDLKKSALSDQGDLKDLRHKVRLLEMEREKAASKQPNVAELKKSLQQLETKRKDDIRERDRRIAELEKHLQVEKKKRELAERDSKRVLEEETQSLHDLQTRLQAAQSESRLVKDKLHNVETDKSHQECELLSRLDHHLSLLNSVAQQYSVLASHSVPLKNYRQLQLDYASLQCRQLRVERKLANTEGQVVELTHFIRQVKEQNTHLSQQLDDALEEIAFMSYHDPVAGLAEDKDLLDIIIRDIDTRLASENVELANANQTTDSLLSNYYSLKSRQLSFASTVLAKEHADATALADQRESDLTSALASHEAIAAKLEFIQKERLASQEAFEQATVEAGKLRTSNTVLEAQLADVRQRLHSSDSIHAAALKKEKDTIQRLTSAVQKNRMAEDALRSEIDQLSADLANAEGYEDAYCQLYEQVGSLIARKEIAEDEANRISKFNAEILGHNNPAQRIMYVDRIRTELAEAKSRIAELVREQENVAAQNNELQHELDMYTSVRIPLENKPRTNLTRVGRPPLVNVTQSLNTSSQRPNAGSHSKPTFKMNVIEPLLEVSNADMTLEEIM